MNCFYRFLLHCYNSVHPYKIYGKENVPEGGAVMICNHYSALDCAWVANVYNKDIYFLAKKELFKNKFFGWLIKTIGAIPIDRENNDVKSMLTVIRLLKEDHKIAIFPEGTRNKNPDEVELQSVKGGSALFAVKAKKPIVPIMILKKPRMFKRTYMIVGKPFEFSEYYNKKLTSEDIMHMGEVVKQKMEEQLHILQKKVKNKDKC